LSAPGTNDQPFGALVLNVSNDRDFDTAFTSLADQKTGALFASDSPFFINQRDQAVLLLTLALGMVV
jgi:hypothetical protein